MGLRRVPASSQRVCQFDTDNRFEAFAHGGSDRVGQRISADMVDQSKLQLGQAAGMRGEGMRFASSGSV